VIHERLHHRAASNQAVDVILGKSGIVESTPCGLDVELCGAETADYADFGIADPDDRDFIFERFRKRPLNGQLTS
jgi:hypothetical protein